MNWRCNCCEPAAAPTGEALLDRQLRFVLAGDYEAKRVEFSRNLCCHEAGHAVAAYACGDKILLVEGGGFQPKVSKRYRIGADGGDELICSMAGDLADRLRADPNWRPSWSRLSHHILWEMDGQSGVCDRCREARILMHGFGGSPIQEIVEIWFGFFDVTAALVETKEWRRAIETLADALAVKPSLTGEEVSELLTTHDVQGAMRRYFEGPECRHAVTGGAACRIGGTAARLEASRPAAFSKEISHEDRN